ncbi:MAG: hypothetical protein WCY12_04025 [Candidatus Omnitrophota bacterium]
MSKTDNIKQDHGRGSTPVFMDLVLILISLLVVFAVSYYFNFFSFLMRLFQDNPKAFIWLDEIIVCLFVLSAGLAIFAWRRWLELKKETAERIRFQEKLITIAETKAETADIISKQLRSEIEYHRKRK